MMDETISRARRHSIADLPRRSAARSPQKPAIRCGAAQYTYAEFDALCSRLAAGLRGLSLQPGDRIAILSRNSHAFAAMRFAIARMGAVLVPINFMLGAGDVAYVLRHSGARMLCLDESSLAVGREAAAMDTAVETLIGLPGETSYAPLADTDFAALAETPPGDIEDHAVDSQSLAQIIYTSGTESLPKGAMLTHDAVLWEYVSCLVDGDIRADDILLQAMPLYHCAQLDVFLGPSLYAGASSVLTGRTAPDDILALIETHGITSFFAPPTVWIGMLRSPRFAQTDLSTLRKGYYGASIMPVEVLRELQTVLPQVKLYNLYGQTEIAPVATVLGPDDQMTRAGSAGRAALNVETRVVDDKGRTVAAGEIGEVVHRSPQLLVGYYNDAEKTAEAFRSGWFHSGDLGVRDADGYLTIVDRKKDMIKTGGENVASRDVEETLYRLPGVSEVAVIGLPHPTWVEAVVAVVVPKSGTDLSAEAVMSHAQTHLASFKRPKQVVIASELPKNPSGKILKRVLRERYLALFEAA